MREPPAARGLCPQCAKFFCRECITEHDDRVLCASCLAKLSVKKTRAKARWEWAPRFALALLAVALVFFAMLLIGNLLVGVPSHFHDKGGW